MGTIAEVEAFYVDGHKSGALIRQLTTSTIQTTVIFRIAGGPVIQLAQRTEFPGDVMQWSRFTYVDVEEGIHVDMRSDEPLVRNRLTKTIPSYAAHVLLKDFLSTSDLSREFGQFHEPLPSAASPAAFVRVGPEMAHTPFGTARALKVTLEVNGCVGNAFWCADGAVIRSDWQGATSYATTDIGFVMSGLDTKVQTLLTGALKEGVRIG